MGTETMIVADETTNETDVNPAEADETATEVNTEEAPASDPEPPQEPEWTPEYKFKVMDKEYEFPEYLKPVIKKENYEEIKDTYLKAYGLPHVKERAAKYEEEIKQMRPIVDQFNQQNQSLDYLSNLLEKGDFATFARELKIPKQHILKYALDLISYDELPPEKKQEYDSNIESRQRLNQLERQNQTFQTQLQQQQLQARNQQLEFELSKPNVTAVASAFDKQAGRPGAFREEVINRAAIVEMQTKGNPNGPTILTPEQAVSETVKIYGQFLQSSPAAVVPPSAPAKEKPVIPNVKGTGKGPVKRKINSIEDLKKIHDQMVE